MLQYSFWLSKKYVSIQNIDLKLQLTFGVIYFQKPMIIVYNWFLTKIFSVKRKSLQLTTIIFNWPPKCFYNKKAISRCFQFYNLGTVLIIIFLCYISKYIYNLIFVDTKKISSCNLTLKKKNQIVTVLVATDSSIITN